MFRFFFFFFFLLQKTKTIYITTTGIYKLCISINVNPRILHRHDREDVVQDLAGVASPRARRGQRLPAGAGADEQRDREPRGARGALVTSRLQHIRRLGHLRGDQGRLRADGAHAGCTLEPLRGPQRADTELADEAAAAASAAATTLRLWIHKKREVGIPHVFFFFFFFCRKTERERFVPNGLFVRFPTV